MRNPFDNLFNRRQRHQRQVKIERDEHQAGSRQADQRAESRLQEKKRYDGMMKRLLEQFIQSADPSLKYYSYDWGWSVGRWDRLAEDNSLRWHSILNIQLVYEMNDTALFFEVTRHRKRLRVGLGEDELVLALYNLYSD